MKKLLSLTLLLATAASADTVDVAVRPGVSGKQMPAVQIRILDRIAGFHLKLKRNDGKEIDVKGGGNPGVTRVIDLDQPDGKFTYVGELNINMPNADVLNMPLQFDTEMYGPLRLVIDKDKDVDLENRKIVFRLNRPAGKAKLQVIGESGNAIFDGEIPFNGEDANSPLEVTWPASKEEILKLSLVGHDQHGFYSGIDLFPYTVYVEHEEVVFDTGKWDIRPDQETKLQKPLGELKKRLNRAKPWAPVKVFVLGHTDTVGDPKSNRALSLNRAKAIGSWFRKKGIDVPILYEGFGEQAPKVATADETAEEKNRRADYILAVEDPVFDNAPFKPRWNKL